jgi:Bifunctional DNA primase/polymerase, N-terminal
MKTNNYPPAGNRGAEENDDASKSSFVSLLDRTPTGMLEAAWELAAVGWEVFPCKWTGPHAKAPMTVNGHLNATTDPDKIKLWWTKWPNAMIGAKVPDSAIVIDVDPRNGGSLGDLEARVGPWPATLTAWSGRNDGGRHLYWRRPTGPLTSTKLPTGIDLKVNGYVIVPPSIHPAAGQPYRWDRHPVAPLPIRLRELLRPAPRTVRRPCRDEGSGAGLVRTVAEAMEGTRKSILYWAACRAVEDGLINQIEDELVAAAMSAGETETKARRTVASARKSGASNV